MSTAARLAAPTALAVALLAGAYLLWYGEPVPGAALPHPAIDPTLVLETTMPTIRSFAALMRSRWSQFAAHLTRDDNSSLRELDDRALADIGVHRSEISSIDAEAHGRSHVTRRRIALGLHHV